MNSLLVDGVITDDTLHPTDVLKLQKSWQALTADEKSSHFSLLQTVCQVLHPKGVVEGHSGHSEQHACPVSHKPLVSIPGVYSDQLHAVESFLEEQSMVKEEPAQAVGSIVDLIVGMLSYGAHLSLLRILVFSLTDKNLSLIRDNSPMPGLFPYFDFIMASRSLMVTIEGSRVVTRFFWPFFR